MYMKVEKITPEKAGEYLLKTKQQNEDGTGGQRRKRASLCRSYAAEINANHWLLTHQGIGFNEQGELIDGQHRLQAIALSGRTVPMAVTRDVPSLMVNGVSINPMDVIDCGAKRTTGEQLSMSHGYSNGNRIASASNVILMWATNGKAKNSTPNALVVLKHYPQIERLASGNKTPFYTAAVVGCFAVAIKSFPELESNFIDSFLSGANLKTKSPALLLRNILINNPYGGYAKMRLWMGWCFNALRAAALNEPIKQIKSGQIGADFFAKVQSKTIAKITEEIGLR